MTQTGFDVVGLGNAIVDVISEANEAFLTQWGIVKNAMNLIEEDRADALIKASVNAIETSGGSGANTIAGIASLGGRGAYIGKVADDRRLSSHQKMSILTWSKPGGFSISKAICSTKPRPWPPLFTRRKLHIPRDAKFR